MSIPSQFPAVVATARSNALQALALQPGQVIEGKVLGPAPGGGTQVQIGEQVLNLALPMTAKPGTVLQFEVQTATAGQVRLVIQPQGTQPGSGVVQPTPPPTEIFVSQAALAVPAGSAAAPTPLPSQIPAIAGAQAGVVTAPQSGLVPTTVTQPVVGAVAGSLPAAAASTVPLAAAGQTVPLVTAYVQTGAVAAAAQPAVGAPIAVAAPTAAVPVAAVGGNAVPQSGVGVAPPPPGQAVVPPPATPQAALTQMVQTAVQRQDSAATLMTALTAIVGKVALPEQVMRAAQQVLAGRVSLENGGLDGTKLQQAVLRSGVFMEAGLARGNAPVAGDMKGSLLALRQTLVNWLGQQAPISQAAIVPPPLPGSQPRARQASAGFANPPIAPEEAGKVLLDRTEATLARVRLHQSAGLPDAAGKARPDISLDLPVLIGNYQTLLHLQVNRDGHNGAETVEERGWQMRFAINMPELGEVGAQVSLRGGATGVMLWASEPETADALQGELAELKLALGEAGLKLGAILVRRGEPVEAAARPGHFVDARS